MKQYTQLCKDILKAVKKHNPKTQKQFNRIKLDVLATYKKQNQKFPIPKNIDILAVASKQERKRYSKVLSMKPVRSAAGVTVVALMSDPYPCPHSLKAIGPCTYCPGGPNSPFGDVPQSYTGAEPSTKRAARVSYDSYLITFGRLEHYVAMNKMPDKIEIIIQGGTFTFFPKLYQEYFIKFSFKAMNDFSQLFFNKKHEIDYQKINDFFELPGDIHNVERTIRVHAKMRYLKYKNLQDKSTLKKAKNLLFKDKQKLNSLLKREIKKHIEIQRKSLNLFSKHRDLKDFPKDSQGRIILKPANPKESQQEANLRLMKTIRDKLKKEDKKNIKLETEQKINETCHVRCIGLTIETKAEYARLLQANEMLKLGCTRVEIGIQTVYDNVLELTDRGNTTQDNIDSIRTLKDLGFKILTHYMPGLPATTKKMDLDGFQYVFDSPDYRPDMMKLYPTMVMPGTKLYEQWKAGKFKPLTTKTAAQLISKMKQHVPEYCRIMRVQRDIPTDVTSSGVDKTNLRQYVDEIVKSENITCKCIRCREIGRFFEQLGYDELEAKEAQKIMSTINAKRTKVGWKKIRNPKKWLNQLMHKTVRVSTKELLKDIQIIARHYIASHGNEMFISAEWNGYLLGFCRLRFPGQFLRKEITERSALIRELHIYGQAVPIGELSFTSAFQHLGLGKKLLETAEKISKSYHKEKLVIISGIGVREYYKNLGYKNEGPYMVKGI
jgi:histone acetyltransferase (RNA polymerase elongator complex component)